MSKSKSFTMTNVINASRSGSYNSKLVQTVTSLHFYQLQLKAYITPIIHVIAIGNTINLDSAFKGINPILNNIFFVSQKFINIFLDV